MTIPVTVPEVWESSDRGNCFKLNIRNNNLMEPNLFSKYFKSVFRVLFKYLGLSDITVHQAVFCPFFRFTQTTCTFVPLSQALVHHRIRKGTGSNHSEFE